MLAHPFSHLDAFTFDWQDRSLSLSQLVQPGAVDRLARAASPFVTWTLNARGNPGCNSDPATITSALVPAPGADQPAAHVGFTRSGLLVAFDDSSFAYYACGYVTVTIPYTALGDVIAPTCLRRCAMATGTDRIGSSRIDEQRGGAGHARSATALGSSAPPASFEGRGAESVASSLESTERRSAP